MHPRSKIWHHALIETRQNGEVSVQFLAETTGIHSELVKDVLTKMCEDGWLVKAGGTYHPTITSREPPTPVVRSF